MTQKVDMKGSTLIVDGVEFTAGGSAGGSVAASGVTVAAYPAGGISSGDLQTVLNALAARITELEP